MIELSLFVIVDIHTGVLRRPKRNKKRRIHETDGVCKQKTRIEIKRPLQHVTTTGQLEPN